MKKGCERCNFTGAVPTSFDSSGCSDFVPCKECRPSFLFNWGRDMMRAHGWGIFISFGTPNYVPRLGERQYRWNFDIVFYCPVRIYR